MCVCVCVCVCVCFSFLFFKFQRGFSVAGAGSTLDPVGVLNESENDY